MNIWEGDSSQVWPDYDTEHTRKYHMEAVHMGLEAQAGFPLDISDVVLFRPLS